MKPALKHLTTATAQLFLLGVHTGLALHILKSVLQQDQLYGMFDWMESPVRQPFFLLLGAACGVLAWRTTERFVTGPRSTENLSTAKLLNSARAISSMAWLISLLLIGMYFFDNPSAPITEQYTAEVLEIYTPKKQSKPYRHYVKLRSWRSTSHETLSTTDYSIAETLHDAGQARVFIGTDWLGRVRVLRAEPIFLTSRRYRAD